MKKAILLSIISLLSTGCTTAINYTEREKQWNGGHPPKMLFGVLKVYPQNSAKILLTPMSEMDLSKARSTYINTTTTVRHSNGTSSTYTTRGYIR